ncbi:hypothetical protein F5Y19DRAFT_457211 [Xylariaceae sp. FL1651]|nr:hypothetical protein F5Y19DRAFT_457211 [Xylariaceae sp. FL1651]
MDLVSSIRKTGSRGGVNFNWEDVATSAHRENYLGHSLKAPVGRWQKGRDLSWYAKGDVTDSLSNETSEEKAARERKEELKKIKEAEEDALARALGLPVAPRNVTGANAVDVGESRITARDGPLPETEGPTPDGAAQRASRHHEDPERRHRHRRRRRSRSQSRNLSRSGDRDRDRDRERRRDRSPRRRDETHHHRSRDDNRDDRSEQKRRRSYSRERDVHRSGQSHGRERNRSRSAEGFERRRFIRDNHRLRSKDRRRSRSPERYRRRSLERD